MFPLLQSCCVTTDVAAIADEARARAPMTTTTAMRAIPLVNRLVMQTPWVGWYTARHTTGSCANPQHRWHAQARSSRFDAVQSPRARRRSKALQTPGVTGGGDLGHPVRPPGGCPRCPPPFPVPEGGGN